MNKKTIITIVIVVLVIAVAAVIMVAGNHGAQPQTQSQLQSAQTGTNNQTQPGQSQSAAPAGGLYTSAADGFSANFSGTPEATKTTFNSPLAGPIPLTKYIAQSGNGASAKYYVIYVYHYPPSYQFPSYYLTAAMQVFATEIGMKYPGAKLASQTPTQLLGGSAVSGVITLPVKGNQENAYLVITTKNQNTYGIGTYNADQSDYNAFVNSFTFTQ